MYCMRRTRGDASINDGKSVIHSRRKRDDVYCCDLLAAVNEIVNRARNSAAENPSAKP